VQNFVKIGQTVSEILRFFYFQDGRHLGFLARDTCPSVCDRSALADYS